ncbi:phage integrase N-terminal SAM-like domain-containing protein [Marinomonas mediterranea]|jgi:hypothetical protein|uniref:phage integrase N-terminal SAM-like domain-containing protein n=1 Tax=Marinomonas mediterranea TaxID=119864 RepID=UPI000A073AC9|nr:hypothetical protein GV053_14090 [Marinomonas mediterranea MMB-1]
MTLEGLSPLTQKAYLYQIGEASRYFNLPPDRIRRADIERYILHLIRDQGLELVKLPTECSCSELFVPEGAV